MSHPDISLVLPIFNEALSLDSCLQRLRSSLDASGANYEVILVENGSTDRTWEVARRWSDGGPNWRCLRHDAPSRSGALRLGAENARGEYVALLDVDHYDLSFIAKALEAVRRGYDCAVGSKGMAGGRDERAVYRGWISRIFNGLLRQIWGWPFSDVHGPKVFRRQTLDFPRLSADLPIDIALLASVYRRGLSSVEIPIIVREQRPSKRSGLYQSIFMLRTLWLSRAAARNP